MFKTGENSPRTALGILLTAAVGVFALIYPLRNLSYDLLFFGRGATAVQEVAIVYLDDASLTRLDSLDVDHLDRRFHAELVRQLNLRDVPVIAFDFLFDRPRKLEEDQALIQAVQSKSNVLVGATLSQAKDGGGDTIIVNAPFPELRKVIEYGLVEGSDSDRICRTLAVPFEIPGKAIETLAWEAAQKRRANRLTDPHRTRGLNYYGPPGHIPSVNFIGVLSNQTANLTLTNTTTVFVGANTQTGSIGGNAGDIFPTPYNIWTQSPLSSGTEVCATAYLNLLRGDWLERLPLPVELLLILLFGGVSAWGLSLLRPWFAAAGALVLGVGLIVSARLLTWNTQPHLWFPWVGMVIIQLPFALAWSVLSHTGRLSDEMDALEKRLRQRAKKRRREEPPGKRAEIPISALATSLDSNPSIPDHELLQVIGEGGFGKVWLARSLLIKDLFRAVKVVRKDPSQENAKFDREFRGIQKFTAISRDHPGFVHILHVGQPPDRSYFYYIMEAADDQTSGQKINPDNYAPKTLLSELSRFPRFPVPGCVELGIALTSALQFLHEKELIHRDIKPSNIIYVNDNPKLADIGLVTDFPREGQQLTYAGTKGYMPPEGPGILGDIYSLGQVLSDAYRGLDRRQKEKGGSPNQSNEFGTQLLEQLISKACEADSIKRHPSAAELHSALLQLQKLIAELAAKPTILT